MTRLNALVSILFVVAPLAVSAQPVDYNRHVQPFFNKYCVECHNAKRPRGGLDLESYEGLMAGSDNGSVLTAGKAASSAIVLVLEGKREPLMPPKKVRVRPKPEEIALLRKWVDSGAKPGNGVAKVVLPRVRSRVPARPAIVDVKWGSTGHRLFAAVGNRVVIIDPRNGLLLRSLTAAPTKVTAIAVSPDERRLAVAWGLPGTPATLALYEFVGTANHTAELWRKESIHADAVQCIAFSPDGRTLISCGYDRQVKLWDAGTGNVRHTLRDHSDSVYEAAYRPDGRLFATCAADRTVKVWDAATAKLLYTLDDATDWLYTLAWSTDGKHLFAAGVDKSIRRWRITPQRGKLEQSVFAHEAAVTALRVASEGNLLVSTGEDRRLKVWDTGSLREVRLLPRQRETPLALALGPIGRRAAIGFFDGSLSIVDLQSGKTLHQPLPNPKFAEIELNDSPGTSQPVAVPSVVEGRISRAGDLDYFRLDLEAGEEVGIRVEKLDKAGWTPFLELSDAHGRILDASDRGFLAVKATTDGAYVVGVRDRDFNGASGWRYRLRLGAIPVVKSVFPLGLQRGSKGWVELTGVHLGSNRRILITIPAEATVGSKVPVTLAKTPQPVLGRPQLVVGGYPEVLEEEGKTVSSMPVPGTANGRISKAGETDLWKFQARKGKRLIIEVAARRLGSRLDSYIEVLDEEGNPVPRAVLRSVAKTHVTFRNHNSVQSNIRIESWNALAVNDYIWLGNELLKIRRLPTHPDSDCVFFSRRGQRRGYLDTTPTYHTKGEPMYKVTMHPPGTVFPPNGFPIITVYYRNDDGGPPFGRDSRIVFDPPSDGTYRVRIGDSRGRGGEDFAYRLTVRPPKPDFTVRFSPTAPKVWKGGALPITVSIDRIDEFEGAVQLRLENVPPGFHAPVTSIPAGEDESTVFALSADSDAKSPKSGPPLRIVATASIDGKQVVRTATGGRPEAVPPRDIITTVDRKEMTITPGHEAKLTVKIERLGNFKGRVPIDVQGLPHGVEVLDLGLNGILITEKETQRTIVLYCHPWMRPMEHPFVISGRREGRNTRHAAPSILLRIVPR